MNRHHLIHNICWTAVSSCSVELNEPTLDVKRPCVEGIEEKYLFITLKVESLVQNAHGLEVLGAGMLQLTSFECSVALLLQGVRAHQLLSC